MLLESILAFGGLIVGLILAFFTKDEIESGTKYFSILERLLLLVLIIFLLYNSWSSFIFLIVSFVAGFMFFIGINRIYLYLGLALFLASKFSLTYFYTFVGLIFILGLVYGTVYSRKKKSKIFWLIILDAVLFAAPFLLVFFDNFIVNYDFVFLPFISGALFAMFLLR